MMDDLLNIPSLGRLEILETFEYYDQPVLFSCKNAAGHLYLVVAADENEQNETWLYAGVSEVRLNLIRSGTIDLHDAFADPEDGFLYQAIVSYDNQSEIQINSIPASQISEDMFPVPGECLDLKTDTLPALNNSSEIAAARKQEILHLALDFGGVFRTEAPAAVLSRILGKLQDLINTIGMMCLDSDKVDENIRKKMQLSIIGVGAGSFDIRLASTEIVDLLGNSDFANAIEELLKLLNAGSHQEELEGLLRRLKARVAKDYAEFLKSLNESVTDTKFTWTSPNPERGGTADISDPQMGDVIEILERFQAEASSTFNITGTLTGALPTSKRFEIKTAEDTFSGTIAEEAIESVSTATLSRTYTAELQEVHERSETTGEITKTGIQLLSLRSQKG